MKYKEIIKLLGKIPDEVPKFITKNRIKLHGNYGVAENRYKPSKQIRFKTSMIQSDLYYSSDAYIVFKGTITVTDPNNNANNACDKELAFKNNASFISCISKINNTLIGHESITGKLENNNVEKKGLEIVVSLKYLINF